jgi:aspartate/methionine/tyrosine aminotransferase
MGYTPSTGLPALRRALAAHYGRRYGLEIDPERVIITTGGSGALQLALAALLDVGDGVLVTEPGYPCHRHIAAIVGAVVHGLPLSASAGWHPTLEQLQENWRAGTRALLLTTPGNPTGAVIGALELAAVHEAVRERAAALIVDETYQGLVYDAEDVTALARGVEDLFVVNSFSKFFGLTGWRLGWLVVPPGWVSVVERLAQNLYLAPPTLAQHVALAALEPDAMAAFDGRRETFRQRRGVLLDALPKLGFPLPAPPQGAFYVFTGLPGGHADAASFATGLLDAVGVAVTPGGDFGGAASAGMLRFAYTEPLPRLRSAVERIADFVSAARHRDALQGAEDGVS